MNQATKSTYRIDLILQGLVFVPMMICYALGFGEEGFFILGALLQFFVGVVQVISGLFHTIKYEDPAHRSYLGAAIGYLAFLFILGSLGAYGPFFIFFLFIVPPCIATWYFYQTYQWLQKAPENSNDPKVKTKFDLDDDVLDDILIS